MTTTNLIQTLKTGAIAKGLCKPWQEKLTSSLSIQELINMYVQGIDFCINTNYPSLDLLRKEFKGRVEPYGLFIDEDNLFLSNIDTVMLHGYCRGTLNYDCYSVSRLYMRHDSRANITIAGNAILTIDAFDTTKTSIVVKDNSKAIIHLHGQAECKIVKKDPQANIKIIQTSANTY